MVAAKSLIGETLVESEALLCPLSHGSSKPMKSRERTRTGPSLKPTIGWREWVRLPDLGVDAIKVKVDTGARTSSLHAFGLREVKRDGVPYVSFSIHPEQKRAHPAVHLELPLLARRRVRDSGGKAELRPVVETVVELLGHRWPIELTLTRRDAMGFRMLLGRQAIRGRFTVDPGRSFLGGKRIRKTRSGSKKG
jgi:hypothetical protein